MADSDQDPVSDDTLRSLPTAYWGLAVMAELAPDDDRVQRLWTESPVGRGTHDLVLERFPEWREMLFEIRDDYAERAAQRLQALIADIAEDPKSLPINLVLNYEWARHWLDGLGLKGVAWPGEDNIEVYRVVHTLRTVTTSVFAGRNRPEVRDVLTAAVDRAHARVTADPRPTSYPELRAADTVTTTIDPFPLGGEPCIRDLQIPVYTVVSMLAEGMSHENILAEHPGMTPEDIRAALRQAAHALRPAP